MNRAKGNGRRAKEPLRTSQTYSLHAIGIVQSSLKERAHAPRQGDEGAPDAWIELAAAFEAGLHLLDAGDDIVVLTWLDRARRDVLQVHPRGDADRPLTGVFATRAPDRPNPIGLHPVKVLEKHGRRLKVGPLEAIDGTPVIDIKPLLAPSP